MPLARSPLDPLAALPPAPAPPRRLLLAIAGVPGAGKSTLAARIAARYGTHRAVVVPADGWHLARAQLDRLPDPAEAHRRRGAPFTFDPAALLAAVSAIRAARDAPVRVPDFDHAVGDPVPDAIEISPSHSVVIVEGLYLLLDIEPWSLIAAEMDFTVRIDIPLDVAAERLAARHLACGLAATRELAMRRATENDLVNARLILDHPIAPDLALPYDVLIGI